MNYEIAVPRLADDDRARRACDVFVGRGMPGDLNITWAYPSRVVAWHKHERQTDNWFVIKGSLKVGLWDGADHEFIYLHEHERKVLSIPPGIWHGYMSLGNEESVLMYYITEHYNQEAPDEQRCTVEQAGVDWGVPVK